MIDDDNDSKKKKNDNDNTNNKRLQVRFRRAFLRVLLPYGRLPHARGLWAKSVVPTMWEPVRPVSSQYQLCPESSNHVKSSNG